MYWKNGFKMFNYVNEFSFFTSRLWLALVLLFNYNKNIYIALSQFIWFFILSLIAEAMSVSHSKNEQKLTSLSPLTTGGCYKIRRVDGERLSSGKHTKDAFLHVLSDVFPGGKNYVIRVYLPPQ